MKRKYIIASAIALAGVVLDQVCKGVIRTALSPDKKIQLVSGFIDLRYAENTGMAFGMLSDLAPGVRIPLFSFIALVAAIIIVHLLRQAPQRSLMLPVTLGLILSGAFGNLIDRFRWGVVVDFIRVRVWPPANYYWPTFNLADSFITIGILLLILDTLLFSREGGEEHEGEISSEEQDPKGGYDQAGSEGEDSQLADRMSE